MSDLCECKVMAFSPTFSNTRAIVSEGRSRRLFLLELMEDIFSSVGELMMCSLVRLVLSRQERYVSEEPVYVTPGEVVGKEPERWS